MNYRDVDSVVNVCLDMANRYDEDIEGCDADELIRYGEGITCCFRLAYIFKYGKFPPKGDAWSSEFTAYSRVLPRNDEVRIEYASLLPPVPKTDNPSTWGFSETLPVLPSTAKIPHNPNGYCGEGGIS